MSSALSCGQRMALCKEAPRNLALGRAGEAGARSLTPEALAVVIGGSVLGSNEGLRGHLCSFTDPSRRTL